MPRINKRDELRYAPGEPVPERPNQPDMAAVAALLDEWMRGDEAEQRETFEVLRRSLDENRPEGYKLFP